ncbi:MAG: tetratricopeptide repeat protein [Planctomycetaceae bacterium]
MLLRKVNNWKLTLVILSLTVTLTGCASSGGFLAKMKPSSIRKAWNKTQTGLEEPASVHESYAKWQEQQGNLTEARQSYDFVLEKNPKSVEAILGLARLDQLAGQSEHAEQMILRAQAISQNDPAVLSTLGQFYVSQGRFSEATDALKQAAHLSPNDTSIQYNLGVALARSGDLDRARPYFVRTVGEAEAHYNIAFILNEMGQSVAAEQELMASLSKKPSLQSSQQLLGEIRAHHSQLMLAQNQGMPQQQAYPAQQFAGAQPGMPVNQPAMGAPIQQVQAQVIGQPQQQVVEAYWQNQNNMAPQNQVMHASGVAQPNGMNVPMIQQQVIGAQPQVQGQPLEQWNPQGAR